MRDPKQIYEAKLKAVKASSTTPRSAVFNALLQSDHEPMTMAELTAAVKSVADRTSVYRTVELFESIGIITRLQIGWKYKLELSDDFHEHHHHITCTKCGATHATHDDHAFESEIEKLAAKHGYTLTNHYLEISGVCNNCLSTNK